MRLVTLKIMEAGLRDAASEALAAQGDMDRQEWDRALKRLHKIAALAQVITRAMEDELNERRLAREWEAVRPSCGVPVVTIESSVVQWPVQSGKTHAMREYAQRNGGGNEL